MSKYRDIFVRHNWKEGHQWYFLLPGIVYFLGLSLKLIQYRHEDQPKKVRYKFASLTLEEIRATLSSSSRNHPDYTSLDNLPVLEPHSVQTWILFLLLELCQPHANMDCEGDEYKNEKFSKENEGLLLETKAQDAQEAKIVK